MAVQLKPIEVPDDGQSPERVVTTNSKIKHKEHESDISHADNYITELLWLMDELGTLSCEVLVNLHKYNEVPPGRVSEKINHAISRLNRIRELYEQQWEQTKFDLER